MVIFFKKFESIHPWSLGVRSETELTCPSCHQNGTYTPHGWLYRGLKSSPLGVRIGKRIICNLNSGGCGKTRRLLPSHGVYGKNQPMEVIVLFIRNLLLGLSIFTAYGEASTVYGSNHGTHWWKKLLKHEPRFRQDLIQRKDRLLPLSPSSNKHTKQRSHRHESQCFRAILNDWWMSSPEGQCPCADFQMRFQLPII